MTLQLASGLKPGRVIRVTLLPGHPGLTQIGSRVILIASGGESHHAQSYTSKVYLYKIQILLFSDRSLGIEI